MLDGFGTMLTSGSNSPIVPKLVVEPADGGRRNAMKRNLNVRLCFILLLSPAFRVSNALIRQQLHTRRLHL